MDSIKSNEIILGLTDNQYRQGIQALSRTDFVKAFESPWLLTKEAKSADEPSKALSFGRLVHMLVLESMERVVEEFRFHPDLKTRRSKEWDLFAAQCKRDGVEACLELELSEALEIKKAVESHAIGREMIAAKYKEAVLVSEIEGHKVKVKFDALHETDDEFIIYDLKTTADASPSGATSSYYSYKYDLQEWFYSVALANAFGKPVKFVFVFVEKEEPFGVGAYEFKGLSDKKIMQAVVALNDLTSLDLNKVKNYTNDKIYTFKGE